MHKKSRKVLLWMQMLFIGNVIFGAASSDSTTFDAVIKADLGQHRTIKLIQNKLALCIDELINEELQGYSLELSPRFYTKNNHWISLYYLRGYQRGKESEILKALESVCTKNFLSTPICVEIVPETGFFGDIVCGNTYAWLVLRVVDPSKTLSKFHADIKAEAAHVYAAHKDEYDNDLFNKERSDQVYQLYVPDISLGHLNISGLKLRMSGTEEEKDARIANLKIRIKKEAATIIAAVLAEKSGVLTVSEFSVYDIQSRRNLKQYALEI